MRGWHQAIVSATLCQNGVSESEQSGSVRNPAVVLLEVIFAHFQRLADD
jgi:hypothetical protein